jgi:hypothetical protein
VNADGTAPADVRAWLLKKQADNAAQGRASMRRVEQSSGESEEQEAALEDALNAFQDGDVDSDKFSVSSGTQSCDSPGGNGLKLGDSCAIHKTCCMQHGAEDANSVDPSQGTHDKDEEVEPASFSEVCALLDSSLVVEAIAAPL